MHIQMNVAVVLEGPYMGKGELESMVPCEKTLVVESPCVARDCMDRIADILPDHDISRFDGQACRLKKVSLMLFHDLDGVNNVTFLEPKSRCLG